MILSLTNAEYSTWGAWAMGSPDISPNAGDQNAAVHLGFWVAGDMLDQSEIPTSGSASMSGKLFLTLLTDTIKQIPITALNNIPVMQRLTALLIGVQAVILANWTLLILIAEIP